MRTYKVARQEILKDLGAQGWKLSDTSLKIPYATSPDGARRLWFKAQAVYFTLGAHEFGRARTLAYELDIRTLATSELVTMVSRRQ